jgi:hypothetical protein
LASPSVIGKNDPFAQIVAQPKIQFNVAPDVRLGIIGTDAIRAVGSTVMLPSAPMLPDRNVNDEICPSPRAVAFATIVAHDERDYGSCRDCHED